LLDQLGQSNLGNVPRQPTDRRVIDGVGKRDLPLGSPSATRFKGLARPVLGHLRRENANAIFVPSNEHLIHQPPDGFETDGKGGHQSLVIFLPLISAIVFKEGEARFTREARGRRRRFGT
jgi:hypothetical protein